jgi:hypothetical protein
MTTDPPPPAKDLAPIVYDEMRRLAARSMRQILVERARARGAQKRWEEP